MARPSRLLRALGGVGLLVVHVGSAAPPPVTDPLPVPSEAVVVDDAGVGLRAIDPATGEERWRLEAPEGVLGTVARGGLLYAGVVTGGGNDTDVYAAPLSSGAPEVVARLPGRAMVAAVALDGRRLTLLDLPPPAPDDWVGTPTGARDLAISEGWLVPATRPAAQRDDGLGVVAPDGQRWSKLRPIRTADGQTDGAELVSVGFDGGRRAAVSTAKIPMSAGYFSLLLAPDGRRLYVVDYQAQTVSVVDAVRGSVERTVAFGRYRYKRPLCAAALSPSGDRLYILANNGSSNAGDGIVVYETASWRPMGHYLPGRELYCLAVSQTGERLYASTSSSALLTIDAATGTEERSVPLDLGNDCCAWLSSAIGPGSAVAATPASGG